MEGKSFKIDVMMQCARESRIVSNEIQLKGTRIVKNGKGGKKEEVSSGISSGRTFFES